MKFNTLIAVLLLPWAVIGDQIDNEIVQDRNLAFRNSRSSAVAARFAGRQAGVSQLLFSFVVL
jgi:hypothetical protein